MIIAMIPQKGFSSNFDTPDTKLKIERLFGTEAIVAEIDLSGLPIKTIRGFSCILDCTYEELNNQHPDAWVTNNPMVGRWITIGEALRRKKAIEELKSIDLGPWDQ